jgi:hypothetical protein
MLRIAIRMLDGDRARYITLISGLAFVALLFVQQGSVFLGLIGRTARPVDTIGAPIWVADPTLQYVDESKPFKDTAFFASGAFRVSSGRSQFSCARFRWSCRTAGTRESG